MDEVLKFNEKKKLITCFTLTFERLSVMRGTEPSKYKYLQRDPGGARSKCRRGSRNSLSRESNDGRRAFNGD
ncbi:hypothetical protein Phum_PHUM098470 [Pediculus humanus corporis]|uniref:Uncharacterized protein n=1 Tax=Pediculus humanus subsp. corporis TaxID=121224 RepID=E0VCW4_PEDHC|nr:uncharacterized protein Phum_PHUM098470 [Pediculus humanus corporis]EEB11220.1 hypothetical protein Phum_PHUM098470 [Pediculus humanus corporis]